jgi:hypothetical protein
MYRTELIKTAPICCLPFPLEGVTSSVPRAQPRPRNILASSAFRLVVHLACSSVEVVHGYAVPLVVANRGCGGLQSEAVPLMASTELSCSAGLQGEAIPLVAAMWPGLWSDKAVPLVGSQSRERRPAEIGQKLCQIITKSSPKLVPCKSKN